MGINNKSCIFNLIAWWKIKYKVYLLKKNLWFFSLKKEGLDWFFRNIELEALVIKLGWKLK